MDYGAAVSQKGYDVKSCADRFLVYSSAFQTLKIHTKTEVSGTCPITLTHNLGFIAPFLVIQQQDDEMGNLAWHRCFDAKNYANSLVIGDDYGGSGTYTVILFLDNFDTVAEKNVNTGTTEGDSSEDYGIRCSKEGYDVTSCTDEQCAFSSSFFSQIIHKKGKDTSHVADVISVSHNLGYVPTFMSFKKKTSWSYIKPMGFGSESILEIDQQRIDSSNLYMGEYDWINDQYYSDYDFYYIIFKNRIASS